MKRKIIFIKDDRSLENIISLKTYRKAFRLWRIPFEEISSSMIDVDVLSSAAVVILEDVRELPATAYDALIMHVKNGGSIVSGGLVGMQSAGTLPGPLAELYGFKEISLAGPGKTQQVPLLVTQANITLPWEQGNVLYFHNHVFTSAYSDQRYCVCDSTAKVIGMSYWVDTTEKEWGFEEGDEATFLIHQPYANGGLVFYAPLPLGAVDGAKPMTSQDGTVYPEMTQENHASLLLMKSIVIELAKRIDSYIPQLALWPGGAQAVISLNGDVHEYPNLAHGNLRCEFSYIPRMQKLLEKRGLKGKYTYCIVGRTFEYHPAVIQEIAHEDIIGHPYDDLGYTVLKIPYEEQLVDMSATLAAIQRTLPTCKTFRLGWRNHGVTGNTDSRHAMEELGFLYASDYQISADIEWNWKKYSRRLVTYVNYPMKTRKPEGGWYQFWELPYQQTDIDLMQRAERGYDTDERTFFHGKGEASRAWNFYVDRCLNEEGLWLAIWHPWASLRKAEEQAEIEKSLDYMQSKKGIAFLSMTETAVWWDHRDKLIVNTEVVCSGWQIIVQNPTDVPLTGVALRLENAANIDFDILCNGQSLQGIKKGQDLFIEFQLNARDETMILIRHK